MDTVEKKILVVDDVAVSLSAAEKALSDEYEVITVNSGVRALRYLERETADLILMDIRMDGKDGFETLKDLRKKANGKNVPVIMLTSSHEKKSVIESSKLGVQDYIVKPFEPRELRKRIKNVLAAANPAANA